MWEMCLKLEKKRYQPEREEVYVELPLDIETRWLYVVIPKLRWSRCMTWERVWLIIARLALTSHSS